MSDFKQVTKEEFNAFIDSYPKPLTEHVVRICDPADKYYRDETIPTKGKAGDMDYFFDKAVAKITFYWQNPDGSVNETDELYEYFIK